MNASPSLLSSFSRERRALTLIAALGLACLAGAQATSSPMTFTTFVGATSAGHADGSGGQARFHAPHDVAMDAGGNLYVSDRFNDTIRKIAPDGTVTTLAGLAGHPGYADGTGSAVRFDEPRGIAVDSAGNVFVADYANHVVRRITPTGIVTTFAGRAGERGSTDGAAAEARLDFPTGLAFDASGNLFVSETRDKIRRITPDGVVSTLIALNSNTSLPHAITVDPAGNVVVADRQNSTIWRVTPSGAITTIAGSAGRAGTEDGVGTAARFQSPEGIASDATGTIYVADTGNATIRKITPDGVVTTLAGAPGRPPTFADGSGAAAAFYLPLGLAVDAAGNIFVADSGNNAIRRITPQSAVTTFAGNGDSRGTLDGTGTAARLAAPSGVALAPNGDLYVTEVANNAVRKIAPGGVTTTFAGGSPFNDHLDGSGNAARFGLPTGIAVDHNSNVYVADAWNHVIRKITPAGAVTTLAGSPRLPGSADGTGTEARFRDPRGLAFSPDGSLYVADSGNHTIRQVTLDGRVTTIAGIAGSPGHATGSGASARLNYPNALTADANGNLFVTDAGNYVVRRVTRSGEVSAGIGTPGERGYADGPANVAKFGWLAGITIERSGNLLVADAGSNSIRRIALPSGDVSTVAGLAFAGGHADGTGPAARFASAAGMVASVSGLVYAADIEANTISIGRPAGLPAITTPPQSQNVTAGSNVVLNVVASGDPELRYAWLFNNGSAPISNAATLTLQNVQADRAGTYVVVVSNSLGEVRSEPVTLAVNAAPTPAPSPAQAPGGSGGGAPSIGFLAALAAALAARRLRVRSTST